MLVPLLVRFAGGERRKRFVQSLGLGRCRCLGNGSRSRRLACRRRQALGQRQPLPAARLRALPVLGQRHSLQAARLRASREQLRRRRCGALLGGRLFLSAQKSRCCECNRECPSREDEPANHFQLPLDGAVTSKEMHINP